MNTSHSRITRREMVVSSSAALAAIAALGPPRASADSASHQHDHDQHRQPLPSPPSPAPAQPDIDYTPVVTPNGLALPWKLVDGVKVFHLVAEEVDHEFAPGLRGRCWGYNGRVHGPSIEAVEGDRVRIYVTNHLPEATSVHWHGVILPNGMDGVAGLTQPLIQPGETFVYEFPLVQHGTHFYHPHHDEMIQMAMGMMGLFIIHPPHPPRPPHSRESEHKGGGRDYAIMLSEWRIDPGTYRPNPLEMLDFNLLTFNGKAFPATEPLHAALGDRVRIRLANGSVNNHHPIHLHGYQFRVTQTDGGQIPPSAQWPETTVLVPAGSTRTFEFTANQPGDWALHCHMLHHTMNQMGHRFPNMIGVDATGLDARIRPLLPRYMTMGHRGMGDMGEHVESGHMSVPENSIPMLGGHGPFGSITMGGMFTVLQVRSADDAQARPAHAGHAAHTSASAAPPFPPSSSMRWYDHPSGTVARPAARDELARDGIDAGAR